MKIIYDLSPVGSTPEKRTGLARVAWSTAIALNNYLGDNISFSACGSIWAAMEAEKLLSIHPELLSAMNRISDLTRQLHYLERNLDIKKDKYYVHSILHGVLNNLSRLSNITRKPIDKNLLAQADIFHSSYARIPSQIRKSLPRCHVLTVHDLTPLVLAPHYFVPGQLGITRRIIDSIQPDDWIITVSDSTRNDLCNRRSVNPEKVVVIPNAASEELFYPVNNTNHIEKVREKYKIPNPHYILSLHSLAPHKNLNHLINCFRKFINQEKLTDICLVISGGQLDSICQTVQSLNLSSREKQQIHFTGYVEEEDLAPLYSGAKAFAFPSLYEGFGLPVLEAMQCGCPVIASNTSSLPEVVGEAGILVSPNDEDMLCQAFLKIYKDEDYCQDLSGKVIERASLFSWNNNVIKTINLYQNILNY